jgi:hypothetical protein
LRNEEGKGGYPIEVSRQPHLLTSSIVSAFLDRFATMILGLPASRVFAVPTAVAVVLGIGSAVVYRRYFHPLAKIPGPFLPAITRLYCWYHNVVKEGTYYKRIDEMHEKYGM